MQKQYSQPKQFAKLFPISVPYTLLSGEVILLNSLSHLQLLSAHETYHSTPETYKINTIKLSTSPTDFDMITYVETDYIMSKILEISSVTNCKLKSIQTALIVHQEDKYKTDDFTSCEVCQSRGLDKRRNCPILGESTYSKSVIYTFKEDNTMLLKECPMYSVNHSDVLHEAYDLLRMMEQGFLPVKGGLLEQTSFVNTVFPIIKPTIDKRRAPMMM